MATINNESNLEKGGTLNEFLWRCSGVNREILHQCPTDYIKYSCLGGMILFGALVSAISSCCCFYILLHNKVLSLTFGLLCGVLLLNLDRYIINTARHDGKISKGYHFFSWMPRFVLAVLLGVGLSKVIKLIPALSVSAICIAIDTTLAFFKMTVTPGPYNDMLNAEKHKLSILSQKIISDINDDVNTQVKMSTQINKELVATVLKANKDLMNDIISTQKKQRNRQNQE